MKKPPFNKGEKGYGELTHQTFQGLNWQFLGKGVQFFLRVLVLAILARLLVPHDFGLVSAAIVVVNFSTIFSRIGIGPALVQRPTINDNHCRTAFTISILMGVVLAIIIFLTSEFVELFFEMPGLSEVLAVLALVFIVRGFTGVPQALLQRDLNFRLLTVAGLVSFGFGYGLIGIVLAFAGLGVWALVVATISQAVVKAIFVMYLRPFPKKPQLNMEATRELIFYGSGFTIAHFFNFLAREGDNFVVGKWLGAELLGLYDRAYQMMKMPASLFGQILETVLFSAMSKIQDQHKRLGRVYRRGTALTALITLPTTVIFLFFAPEIIRVVLGPGWEEAILPFRILAIGTLFRTSYKIGDSVAQATGAVYKRAWRQAIYALLVVFGAWAGSFWGIQGVAWAILFAISINYILMAQLSLALSRLKVLDYLKCHGPAFLLSLLIALEMLVFKTYMEFLGVSPLITLLGAGGIIILTLVTLLYVAPKRFFGEEGLWMLGLVWETGSSYWGKIRKKK